MLYFWPFRPSSDQFRSKFLTVECLVQLSVFFCDPLLLFLFFSFECCCIFQCFV